MDKTFLPFDRAIFSWMHALQQKAGGFMNGFCKFISFWGEMGWAFIALAFVFLLFARTRRHGAGMAFALLMGAIVTNILLKNIVDRARPFTREGLPFADWWQAAGHSPEDSASFPSGHTTAAFASMVALFILGNKKYSWAGLVFAFVMAFSRVYLIVHYPTDVLAGMIVGTCAGIGGAALSKLLYKKARGKLRTVLESWSMATLCARLFKKQAPVPETSTESPNEQPLQTDQQPKQETEPDTVENPDTPTKE